MDCRPVWSCEVITLDYAETTGLHLRVGLVDESGVDVESDLESAARDLVGGPLGTCWDVNQTSATTAELSFER